MLTTLLIVLTTVLCGIITYFKWRYQYWKNRNLPYLEPTIPFGNLDNPITSRKAQADIFFDMYLKLKKRNLKHGGVFVLTNPIYFPLDLDLIKDILTKDFSHFVDHNFYCNEKDDPLTGHLFALEGARWRSVRTKMTPVFTSGKMKVMFNTVLECGNILSEAFEKKVDKHEIIDIKEVAARYTTDVIGSCAFGLDCNSIKDDNSPFRVYGRQAMQRSGLRAIKFLFVFNFPDLARALHIKTTPNDIANFFLNVVKDTIEYREKNNVRRNDFMQMMIDLKNDKLDDGGTKTDCDDLKLTVEQIAAQCFVFFIGGFETSSSSLSFIFLELSRNPDIQDKVREEVNRILKKYDGEVTYEGMMEMKYMDQVINESMRLYPSVPMTNRKCTKEYVIPGTNITIAKGTGCLIPIMGIHRDEQYYPDPEKFDPERFSPENKNARHPFSFMPFGEGPRICIGLRFGMMQIKIAMIVLLRKYKFTLDPKTKLPIKFSKDAIFLEVEGGTWLRAEKL